jgi:hypothetical protein
MESVGFGSRGAGGAAVCGGWVVEGIPSGSTLVKTCRVRRRFFLTRRGGRGELLGVRPTGSVGAIVEGAVVVTSWAGGVLSGEGICCIAGGVGSTGWMGVKDCNGAVVMSCTAEAHAGVGGCCSAVCIGVNV